jgi:hypothetical protein
MSEVHPTLVVKGEDSEKNNTEIVSLPEKEENSVTIRESLDVPQEQKVLEFLKILEEYRLKCEKEGNYQEAERANKQLTVLRNQEEKRQQKALRMKQIIEIQDISKANNQQFEEFSHSWEKYLEEYDEMATQYIQQMTERHSIAIANLQSNFKEEMIAKPPRWSKELLEQRRRQHICARNRSYKEAQELKRVCDLIEERELNIMEQDHAVIFARREAKLRIKQQAELQALIKRIECRRKEHVKQRNLDSKRLLQRNRNVLSTLESRHHLETQKIFDHIRRSVFQPFHQLVEVTPLEKGRSRSASMTPTRNIVGMNRNFISVPPSAEKSINEATVSRTKRLSKQLDKEKVDGVSSGSDENDGSNKNDSSFETSTTEAISYDNNPAFLSSRGPILESN